MQYEPRQPDPVDPSGAGPFSRQVGGVEGAQRHALEDKLALLRRRLIRQATLATGMLETALESLWSLDAALVAEVLRRDDQIDLEEVLLEEACFELLALQKPFARDFRGITFILKVNGDVERVADHACSIAKSARKLSGGSEVCWPTALREMGERVPMQCHALLRAVVAEDIEQARELVLGDKTIDKLDKQLFRECAALIERDPSRAEQGLRIARIGRDLERIGDLMANIAEDVVYLATGTIIRHEKRKQGPRPA
ncbi:MAG: phosphate signaling complex protein PhoU [Planctomycetota bacterium]